MQSEVQQLVRTLLIDERIGALNGLIVSCEEAARGYREASARLGDDPLAMLLDAYGRQKTAFAQELSRELERLGAGPAGGVRVRLMLRRGWLSLRTLLDHSEPAVLERCMQLEHETLKSYGGALGAPLDLQVRKIVERQAHEVRKIIVFLDALHRRAKKRVQEPHPARPIRPPRRASVPHM